MKLTIKSRAILLISMILFLGLGSILVLLPALNKPAASYTAFLYQNGSLLYEIPLSQVTESYELQITDGDGGCNLVQVRPGSIGILQADCPDKVCVSQGFLTDSLLPITCLPHHLVIELKADEAVPDGTDVDGITH